MGVFGGNYFAMADEESMEGLGEATELAWQNRQVWYNKERNYYQVRAGEDYAAWMRNGWIFPEDPLGWFHWYCRYHAGRKHERDDHQKQRWVNYKRWAKVARTQAFTKGDASNVVKQGLIQWAWAPIQIIHGDIDLM